MRDTDRAWHSRIVALAHSGIASLADLRGRRVGFGDADSPQAQILPVHALRVQGWEPARDFVTTRLDRDLGKHGDTGGAELAQLARVRAGELDACVVSSVTHDAIERMGGASELVTLWRSPPFHHCCFTVVSDNPGHARFAELLFSMDAADPKLCEPMELEYVNQWVPFDDGGYVDLIDAVSAATAATSPAFDTRSLARALAAFRIFFGLILFSNGLAKLFAFTEVYIGPYKTTLIDRPEARAILDFEINKRGGDGTDLPLLKSIVNNVMLDHWGLFQWITTALELGAGLALILGIASRA